MLRLKNFTMVIVTLKRRAIPFQSIVQAPAFNFARLTGLTTRKKMMKEFEDEEAMMKEMEKMRLEHEQGQGQGQEGEGEEDANEESDVEEVDPDEAESNEMLKQLNSKEFDRKLDKLIEKKLAEGKSHEEIVNEFFGTGPKKRRRQRIEDEEEEQEENEEGEEFDESQKYFMFEEKPPGLRDVFEGPTSKEAVSQRKLMAELEEMETLTEILGQAKGEPLSQFGRSDLRYMGNKMTKEEKANMAIRKAMLESQVFASTGRPPTDMEPQMFLRDKEVHEEVDFEKERQLEEAKTTALDIQEEEEEQLRVPETKEEKRLRLKVEGGLVESKKKEDLEFRKEVRNDLTEAAKELGITLQESKAGDSRLASAKIDLGPTIYEKVEKKMAAFIKEFDLDPELKKDFVKEEIFRLKKMDEAEQKMKELAKKKERKRKIGKLVDELQEMEVQKGIDYDEEDAEEEFIKELRKKKFLDINDLKKINEEDILMSNNPLESSDGRGYEIHRMRTQRNIEDYLPHLLSSQNQRIMSGVQLGSPISVVEVILNRALTVINVFWVTTDKNLTPLHKNHKNVKILEKNLFKFAGWARGKLCRDLQFKYAPEIRFYYSEEGQTHEEIRREHERTAEAILKQTLQDEIEKGTIKSKADYMKSSVLAEEDIERSFFEYTKKYSHASIMKANKDKYNEDGSVKRNNKNPDGGKKKFKRENKGKKFWDSLPS